MSSEPRPVTVLPAGADARTTVGPFAWVVFEDMASRSGTGEVPVVVADSVRSVASRLAFSKDTVARALRRLSEAGLVERIVEREKSPVDSAGRATACTSTGPGWRWPPRSRPPLTRTAGPRQAVPSPPGRSGLLARS